MEVLVTTESNQRVDSSDQPDEKLRHSDRRNFGASRATNRRGDEQSHEAKPFLSYRIRRRGGRGACEITRGGQKSKKYHIRIKNKKTTKSKS